RVSPVARSQTIGPNEPNRMTSVVVGIFSSLNNPRPIGVVFDNSPSTRPLASHSDRAVVRIDPSIARRLMRGAQVHRRVLDDNRIIRRADPLAAYTRVIAAFAADRTRLNRDAFILVVRV